MEEEKDVKGLRFFRVLLPGFTSKLLLPRDFINQINGIRRGKATLLSPNGKMWDVDLYKEIKAVYFGGENWKEFITANSLGVGYVIVFHYKGNMVFSFWAFDLSTKEISYSRVFMQSCKRKKETIVAETADDLESNNIEQSVAPTRKKRMQCATDKEQVEESVKAQFELSIEHCNLSRHRWCVKMPEGIANSCGLMNGHISEVTVEDPKDRIWNFGLQRASRSRAIYVSKGWKEFSQANELKVGDKCIVQLTLQVKKNQLMMKIRTVNSINGIPIVTNAQTTSSFESVIRLENINSNYMHIPVRFMKLNDLESCSELSLIDPTGKMWLVNLFHRRERGQTYMSKGWLEFARSNNLGIGDTCNFKMLLKEEGNIVIQVYVQKKPH